MDADDTGSGCREFRFRFDRRYRVIGRLFGITDQRSVVRVTDQDLIAVFGPWTVRTALTNICSATITGPYHLLRTVGPARWSLADHGLTFASNGDKGVCVEFAAPVTGLDPLGILHHPNLTATVADPEGLVEMLAHPAG